MTEAHSPIGVASASRLEVRGLTLVSASGDILVHDVNLAIAAGETLALVGESGSGKSLTALAILGLLPSGITLRSGRILLDGTDVTGLTGLNARIRGRRVASIFQDPQASLDPRWTVGRYLDDQFRRLRGLQGAEARRAAVEMLENVGLKDVQRIFTAFPHELSGGMAQRVMIAGALGQPQFLIADEPTTALDVTTQAQILDLLEDVQKTTGLGILMITHDLGVVAEIARRTVVLYGGTVMETGATFDVLTAPKHPYTRALLASMPDLELADPPRPIPGHPGDRPPSAAACPFQPRCGEALGPCATKSPPIITQDNRSYACHRHDPVSPREIHLAAR